MKSTSTGRGRKRLRACGDRRRRYGNSARGAVAHLRALFYDQRRGRGNRARPGRGASHREKNARAHYRKISSGRHAIPSANSDSSGDVIPRETTMAENCTHVDQVKRVKPKTKGCEECLKMGDSWVHLRLCLSCGHVGCCDSSKNKHATKHFHTTNHPIIRSQH